MTVTLIACLLLTAIPATVSRPPDQALERFFSTLSMPVRERLLIDGDTEIYLNDSRVDSMKDIPADAEIIRLDLGGTFVDGAWHVNRIDFRHPPKKKE